MKGCQMIKARPPDDFKQGCQMINRRVTKEKIKESFCCDGHDPSRKMKRDFKKLSRLNLNKSLIFSTTMFFSTFAFQDFIGFSDIHQERSSSS